MIVNKKIIRNIPVIGILLTKIYRLLKYKLIDNVYQEVIDWLDSDNLNYIENNIIVDDETTLKSININDNVLIIVVDDYSVYNKVKLGKDISSAEASK